MNIRRTLAATAASLVVVGALVAGGAAPASAEPALIIPSCANMFGDSAAYWDLFASINGQSAVAYHPAHHLYGSDNATLRRYLAAWHATNCTWGLAKSPSTANFTISEVHMNRHSSNKLRHFFAVHHISGTDDEPTLGGFSYHPSANEWDVLMHGRVWVSITARGTDIFGYTTQSAAYTIVDLDPWILNGTE